MPVFALAIGYLRPHSVIYSLKSFKDSKNSTNVQKDVLSHETPCNDTKICLVKASCLVCVLLNTKEDIPKNVGNRPVLGTIDFHSICLSTMEVNRAPKQPCYKTFFKVSSFVFGRTKKFIQVWNYLRVSK